MAIILSVWTVIVTILFTGIAAWAWSGKNKARFEEAARIPLDDDDSADSYNEGSGNG